MYDCDSADVWIMHQLGWPIEVAEDAKRVLKGDVVTVKPLADPDAGREGPALVDQNQLGGPVEVWFENGSRRFERRDVERTGRNVDVSNLPSVPERKV